MEGKVLKWIKHVGCRVDEGMIGESSLMYTEKGKKTEYS